MAAVLLVGCGPSTPDITIHEAAGKGDIEAVKQHLAVSTDVNVKGMGNMTPLHGAASNGHKEVIELLIAKGADVNAQDKDYATPLDWAKRHPEIADLLRKHGGKMGVGHRLQTSQFTKLPLKESSKPSNSIWMLGLM